MRTTDFIDDVAENGLPGIIPFHLFQLPGDCDEPYIPDEFLDYLNAAN